MRIGMAQMDISWENIEDNKKKVEEFFQKAVENQVDCIVFPEMTLTGFSMNVEETGEKAKTSKLIIYGENYFVSDYQLTQSTQTPMIAYRQNKDLVLNSIAYLADREEDITVRKSTGAVTYTATEQENKIILAIITFVPLLIIVIGIIVWANRRRKK